MAGPVDGLSDRRRGEDRERGEEQSELPHHAPAFARRVSQPRKARSRASGGSSVASVGSMEPDVNNATGRPLPKKLGIKPESRVLLLNAPDGVDLERPVIRRASGLADVILSFHTERRDLERRLPTLRTHLVQDGRLWIAWPKKASKRPTDITEDVVRELALANALVDNKVAAIDAVWSGLQLVIRVRDRLP